MDGFQIIATNSLKYRLSLWLTLIVIIVISFTLLYSFKVIFEEGEEWQDDQLMQVADLLANNSELYREGLNYENLDYTGGVSPLIIKIVNERYADPFTLGDQVSVNPQQIKDGLQTIEQDGSTYRVFVKSMRNTGRIFVAQSTSERDSTALENSIATIFPVVLLIPIIVLIVYLTVSRLLAPLVGVANELDERDEWGLKPLSQSNLPTEIKPFLTAINQLISRVTASMAVQQRFIADAAHELRTPLTAVSLQVERLAKVDLSDEAKDRLKSLTEGIMRTRTLLEQLFSLVRAQTNKKVPQSTISMREVIKSAIEELVPHALEKNIDLGISDEVDAEILANEFDLSILVKNLIDNAIKYTPINGIIDVSIVSNSEGAILMVRDTGPGVPVLEQDRVFDPFYRVLGSSETGSGLGLAIVKTIVERVGGKIKLEFAEPQNNTGMLVSVFFPLNTLDEQQRAVASKERLETP